MSKQLTDYLPKGYERKPYVPPPYVTPYLSPESEKAIESYEKTSRQPAFVLAFQRTPGGCPNCAGMGQVFVRYCNGGPYKTAKMTKQAVTYFDGNGQFPAGWYQIKETRAMICPECNGRG